MYRRILVPTDGTELCSLALDTALGLAQLGGGSIVGLHALPPELDAAVDTAADAATGAAPGALDPAQHAWQDEREAQAHDAVAYVRRRAEEAGVPCETVLAHESTPHAAIERVAREYGCDLVVLAAHAQRGLRARLLGGEAEKLIAHGTVPLLIVR